jgi:GTPase SAR1 family protein
MKRLTTGDFKEDHDVTVGVEFTGYDIRIEDMVIRLQIWDTAG